LEIVRETVKSAESVRVLTFHGYNVF